MSQLGTSLREAREAKGLSPQDIFNATKIRQNILFALEAEDYAGLPAPVFVRGLIRTLAKPLGLNAYELLALYEDAVPEARKVPVERTMALVPVLPNRPTLEGARRFGIPKIAILAERPARINIPKRVNISMRLSFPERIHISPDWLARISVAQRWLRRRPSTNVVWGLAAAVLFVGGVGWGGTQLMRGLSTVRLISAAQVEPTATLAFALNPTLLPPITPTTRPTAPPATATPLPPAASNVEVKLDIAVRSWLRVEVDGAEAYEGILEAGTSRSFTGRTRITMRAGNAGGVNISINGQPQGLLGGNGEVVDRQWQLTDNGTVGVTAPNWTNNPGPILAPRKP